jgi:hypothetical protein
VVASHSAITPPCSANLLIADIDLLPPMWWKRLSELRPRERFIPLILVSSRWANYAQLRSWRPCGYVRKPFCVDDLLRVVLDLITGIAA